MYIIVNCQPFLVPCSSITLLADTVHVKRKCPIVPLPRARETCPKSASLIDLRRCVNMPDARGRHDTACQIEWQPIEDIAQEWYRDFGCDYDDEARMYLPTGSQRRMLLNRIESFLSVLKTKASLFSERYRKFELKRLVPKDSVQHRLEESWLQMNYRQRLHEFDTDCAVDNSRVSLRRWLKHNTDGRFRPEFAMVKPVPGANAGIKAEYTESCRSGMEFLKSAEGESLKSYFLDLTPYAREYSIARYGTWAAALADQDYGCTEKEIGSQFLCDLLNALGRAIIGPNYRNLFHWAEKLTSDADEMYSNPDDQEDDSHAELDVVVLRRGRETLGAFNHDEFVAVGSGTTEAWNDMDWKKSVLPLMIGVVSPVINSINIVYA
jgi:hypothetical protein